MSTADPFEVRIKFTHQLQHLNASVNSAQKAANYAIRFKDLHEDLHSCILEQLERNNMNNRANIMYFIEQLCDMSQREDHKEFITMIQRDIGRIIDAVAPSDGSGAANVKVARKVLVGLKSRQIVTPEAMTELEERLRERDTLPAHPALSPSAEDGEASQTPSKPHSPSASKPNGTSRPDKRQIEIRIEEDRERHKRLRENIWAISSEDNQEFEKMWDDASDIDDDDYVKAWEDVRERKPWYKEREKKERHKTE